MRITPIAQGVFYVVTGLWPIVHLRSFEAVAGKKREGWLVQTTGALITAVGLALIVGARRAGRSEQTLGIASAAALGAADVVFVATGRIPRVYLLDAAAEAAAIGGWLVEA